MQYRIDGQRIIAFDDQEPLVGEISFPKVPDTNDHVVVERVFVQPTYRGQGIAAELVRQFVDYATKKTIHCQAHVSICGSAIQTTSRISATIASCRSL